jgi:hypothetical protein
MRAKKLPFFTQPEARKVLLESCKRHGTNIRLLEQLIDLQRDYVGSGRREGINSDLDNVLGDFLET